MNMKQEKNERNDLTYEEFIEISKNPPKWKGKTIFRLMKVVFGWYEERRRYPTYSVDWLTQTYFQTLEAAERVMRKNHLNKENIYCYYLLECPFGVEMWDKQYVSCRVYDKDGCLIERSLCADLLNGEYECERFFGRPVEMRRFKPGDIVEVLHGDMVRLSIVVRIGRTPQEAWEYHNRKKENCLDWHKENNTCEKTTAPGFFIRNEFFCDNSNDQYYCIYGPTDAVGPVDHHDHVHPTNIFEPHLKVSKRMRERFEKYYNDLIEQERRLAHS